MVVDTLTYYLVSNEIDTLERSKSTIPGEINEIVHIERKTVLYHNTKVSSPFEVQIWAAEGSGIFEAYVFFFCEDLYYVNFVGNVSFGIGDYSSIGYNPKYTIGTKTFRDVWGNFSAYGDIIIEAEGYTPSFKADSSDLWFDPDYGVLKMIKEQALVLTAVL
ncbi:MAG: hypothetical protein KDC76_00065 [Bacteroidetes bacterium]|nr:hypothetical protein [Bacteroidota bacterium]